jgi:lysine 2,3-aminomutase
MENSICTVEQLKDFIDLSPKEEKKLKQITQRHPMRVTAYYMSLIDWDDPDDPIRKMAIPSVKEFNLQGSYDTSGEAENTKLSGLQHKYQETALILATNKCATYCRHCFRKRLVFNNTLLLGS